MLLNYVADWRVLYSVLEPSHALAFLLRYKKNLNKNSLIIMNMCGRGDKDIFAISKFLGVNI